MVELRLFVDLFLEVVDLKGISVFDSVVKLDGDLLVVQEDLVSFLFVFYHHLLTVCECLRANDHFVLLNPKGSVEMLSILDDWAFDRLFTGVQIDYVLRGRLALDQAKVLFFLQLKEHSEKPDMWEIGFDFDHLVQIAEGEAQMILLSYLVLLFWVNYILSV